MNGQNGKNWNELLHAHVDGEIDADDKLALEAEMEGSEELREMRAAIQEMGDLLRASDEAAADAADFSQLWAKIETGIDAAEAVRPVATADAIDPLQIQAFADGQLSGKAAFDVAAAVAQSESARAEISALGEMGDLLRMASDDAVESADFSQLWKRLDSELSPEFEKVGGFSRDREPAAAPKLSLFDRVVVALGGYRSVLLSAATAAAVVLIMLPLTNGISNGGDSDEPDDLNLRMVHIDEVRSEPGYAVTVDHSDDTAPVIYFTPQADEEAPDGDELDDEAHPNRGQNHGVHPREGDDNERFSNPI